MRSSMVLLFAVVVSCIPGVRSGAEDIFYVAPDGSDSHPGTFSMPWQTITHAAETLVAGQTAVLLDGAYEEGSINFRNSGTASRPITVRASHRHGAVLRSLAGCAPAISIAQSYITVVGLHITVSTHNEPCPELTSANAAIRCWSDSVPTPAAPRTVHEACTIREVLIDEIPGKTVGIKTNQDVSLIEHNEVHSSLEAFNNYGTIFRNNVVYGGDAWGDSVYGKGGVRNLQIYNNVIHVTDPNGRGLFLGGNSSCCWYDDATHIEAYNSVAYNNVILNQNGSRAGLGLVGTQESALLNNVVIGGQLFVALGSQTGYDPRPASVNPVIVNNILVCADHNAMSRDEWLYTGTLNLDYNLFHCSQAPRQDHPIVGSPGFVDQRSDWHVQPTSPALRAGVPIQVKGFEGEDIDVSKNVDGVKRETPWNVGIY